MKPRDKEILQRKLEELYCGPQCDICICGRGCGCCKVATDKCDCCVEPMQNLLQELQRLLQATDSLTITYTPGIEETIFINEIASITDSLITLTNGEEISICNISRVRWDNGDIIDQINLLPAVCTCGECNCCERPLREKLNRIPDGAEIEVSFIGGSQSQAVEKRGVGLGILTAIDSTERSGVAFSICKILNYIPV